jgi:hypothetical protein
VGRTTGGRQAGHGSRPLRDRILAGLETFLVMDNMELGTESASVADPDPKPDPYVFVPPGSGSFYHQAKSIDHLQKLISRKTF